MNNVAASEPGTAAAPAAAAAEVARTLLIVGTPFGTWDALVRNWTAHVSDGRYVVSDAYRAWHDRVIGDPGQWAARNPWRLDAAGLQAAARDIADELSGQKGPLVAFDARGCWSFEAFAEALPLARFLVVVESPVRSLAAMLAHDADLDVAAFLGRWCEGARSLLRHAYDGTGRSVLVDADECRERPAALSELCRRKFGIALETSPIADAPADALLEVIARVSIDEGGEALGLFARLRAGCALLGAAATGPGAAGLALIQPIGTANAMASYRRLLQSGQRVADLERVVDQLQSEPTEADQDLRRRNDDLQRDNDLLVEQARQVQEELEYYHAQSLRGPGAALATAGPAIVAAEQRRPFARIELGVARDTPPYREFSLAVRRVELGDRRANLMDARLVEHQGKPGLVIFADAALSPISRWVESGVEEGRGYMLLIPSDRTSRRVLAALSSSDWQFILALADAAVDAFASPVVPAFWRLTAARLRLQLRELPPAFRHDGFRVANGGSDGGHAAAEIGFSNVSWLDRHFDTLELAWRLGARADRDQLAILGGRDTCMQFGSWPTADDGAPLTRWELPLIGAARGTEKRRFWETLSAGDRAFFSAFLQALAALASDGRWMEATREAPFTALADRVRLPQARARAPMRLVQLKEFARALVVRSRQP
jgi:hypothetical protein